MTSLKNSPDILKTEPDQMPLKGFRHEVKSGKAGWTKMIEGMGDGRVRIHMTKNKK